ncbi:hypothetical protein DFH29DRAFT_943019 [Suillus ampliporus]|nr:hypothetical protein DFH29DRAFT_943019 [Suillus ampliporus]
MNRLASDPSLEHCPDYTSDIYQAIRARLLNQNTNDAQVVAILQNVWVVTNNTHRVQWQRQVEEERKKNPLKYILIPNHPRPSHATDSVLISDSAFRKLVEGQYVELYYWTNMGLADAKGMVPSSGPESSNTAGPARPAAAVIPDHGLNTLDFAQAVHRAVASFKQCGWANQRVEMLAGFWRALMLHRYWTAVDPLYQRALLDYQDEQRRAWHQAIPLPDGAWDISILDDAEIVKTHDRIYREDRCRRDDEWDFQRLQSYPRGAQDDHSSTRRARRSRRSSARHHPTGLPSSRGPRRSASPPVHSNPAFSRN